MSTSVLVVTVAEWLEYWTISRENPVLNPLAAVFRSLGNFASRCFSLFSCMLEYLALDSDGYVNE